MCRTARVITLIRTTINARSIVLKLSFSIKPAGGFFWCKFLCMVTLYTW